MSKLHAVVLVLVLALSTVPAMADKVQDEAKQKARTEYVEGSKHYKLFEYQKALERFKESFRAYPAPETLFNIGQCYRMLDQKAEAIRTFRAYLGETKINRAEVEQIIDTLERSLAEDGKAKPSTGPVVSKSKPTPVTPTPVTPTPATPTPATSTPVTPTPVTPRPLPPPPPSPPPAVAAKPAPTPKPAQRPAPAPAPAPVARPAPVPPPAVTTTTQTRVATSPEKKPLHKKGWFWGVLVGAVIVVGAGVGVGVALGTSKTTFPETNAGGGTFRF